MSNILPANRVAAIAAFATGLGGAILAVENQFPKNWQNTAIAIAGIVGAVGTALHFMLGSQKSEANTTALQMRQLELEADKVISLADYRNRKGSEITGSETTETGNTADSETPNIQEQLANYKPVSNFSPKNMMAPETPVEPKAIISASSLDTERRVS